MKALYWVTGINPEPWAIGTPYRRGSKGLGISPNGKLKAYQAGLTEEFYVQNPHAVVHQGDLQVTFYFWRSSAHGQPADATNLMKATEDALQGILYDNDRSNRDVRSIIMEQSPPTSPHIMIEVDQFVRPSVVPPESMVIPQWAGSDWEEPSEELF
jgi:Holliday junction resolvase RusA-like endonuclease